MVLAERTGDREERKRPTREHHTDEQWTLVQEVLAQYRAAYDAKVEIGLYDDMTTADDYWRGAQVSAEDDDDPASNTNIIRPAVEGLVSDLTDENLAIRVKGEEKGDALREEQAYAWCEWIRHKSRLTVRLDRFERWRAKYGTAGLHLYHDPDANDGLGGILLGVENPANLFPDPKCKASHLTDEGEFFAIAVVKPLSYFKKSFADDTGLGKGRGALVTEEGTPDRDTQVFDDENAMAQENYGANRAHLILRYSYRDDGTLRVVKVANLEEPVLLYDSEVHRKGKGFYKSLRHRYPVRCVPFYPRDGMVWGDSYTRDLEPIQDLINDLDDQIRLNARLRGNFQTLIGAGSGIDPLKWTPTAGLRIPVNDISQVKEVQPPELPRYIVERRETAKHEAERVSQRPDVQEGRLPTGEIPSGKAIQSLQAMAGRKSGHHRLILSQNLGEMFEIALELVKEFITEARPITNPNPQPGEDTHLWLRGRDLAKVPKLVYEFHDPRDPEQGGQWKRLLDKDGNPMTKDGRFNVEASIGAGLPRNPVFTHTAARELLGAGLDKWLTPEEQSRVARKLWRDIGVAIPEEPPMPLGGPAAALPGAPGMAGVPGAPPGMLPGGPAPVGPAPVPQQAPAVDPGVQAAMEAINQLPGPLRQAVLEVIGG